MGFTNASKIYKLVGAEATLTEAADLRKYLTGIPTSFGYVVSDKNGNTFYTDSRYIEGAQLALSGSEIAVKQFKAPLIDLLSEYKEVAIPVGRTLYSDYQKLIEAGLEVKDSLPAFTTAMSVKEVYELEFIRKACDITDRAFQALLELIKEGMTENDVAALLEYLMRKFGASGTSFETIVAFGENSSVPHHETGFRKLKYGDIILIDFGCKYGGYCSDCTRTFLFGDDGQHEEFKSAYEKVLTAHMLVKDKVTCGMTGKQADAIARDYLKEFDLDKYFTHSLGHGIGINIHEYPFVSPRSEDKLLNGMVFSDEPGVYFEGKFGIRIEDTITLDKGRIISLTDSDKKLTIL
ncbi:MAG: aminopeptidase P family protein [Clostridia bacterium]|nr:aminopeptidase P family protein [Clostridia bacterium]